MATKTTTRKTTKKSPARSTRAVTKSSAKNNACTVKECLEQHPVLRFHATILTALSIVICLLVAVLLISLTNQ
ncbi:MAG: hypothetical protein Q4C03_03955 [bacterium]|nr:hypothetical protein [bacterium]